MRNGIHADVQSRLDAYRRGTLGDVEWVLVRTHLAECGRCRAALARPLVPNRAVPRWVSPPPAPAAGGAGWSVLLGTTLVAVLVVLGVGVALAATAS
ncbi:zf-HC2 domain-containing protein [Saccharopolyspora rosea]|uniref:Zf-HC2 domain-containing protein n=1 Tax=Saccharopolyspora rosea TaxID=524884 RepID=A0ABW3FZY1_9PSEU|nr:zf-HC2 domain-containing protein [Saccharopolyspora rosea]